tara:strand:+ start:123 stop:254 length:132 start_codon:yes stop_codon:yes gene_type:complete
VEINGVSFYHFKHLTEQVDGYDLVDLPDKVFDKKDLRVRKQKN